MRGWRGVLGGILTLSVLYVITDVGAAGRLGGLFTDVSKLIAGGMERLSNPSTAGLKDFSKAGSGAKGSTSNLGAKAASAVAASAKGLTARKPSQVPPIRGPQ